MRHVLFVDGWAWTLRPAREDPDEDHAPEFRDRTRARGFVRRASAVRGNRRALRAALRDGGRFEGLHRRDEAEILRVAAEAIASGSLLVGWLVPQRPLAGGASSPPGEVEPVPVKEIEEKKEQELTWIEIELLDVEGKPVPDVEYEIEIPDGSTRTGKLDAQGRAKERGLDPGTCKVKFPSLTPEAW